MTLHERERALRERSDWLPLIVAAPGLLGAVFGVMWVLATASHIPPIGGEMTLAEAAVVADQADVVRLIRKGADPNAPAVVRAGLVDLREHHWRPLEAATQSGQPAMAQMLIRQGAKVAIP